MKVCISLAVAAVAAAQDAGTARGWDHFYNLEFDEAIPAFERVAVQTPRDAAAFNHVAQAVLFRAMLKAGALESEMVTGGNSFLRRERMNPSPAEHKQFEDAIGRCMSLSQERLRRDPNEKAALYDLGVGHALRANYNFLVRKAWIDSLRDATAGRKLHNKLSELDPGFTDARMLQGVHDYLVGILPWQYKVLGFLAGFRGDREQGVRTLQLVAAKGERNRTDAKILLATIYRRERRAQEAVPLLNELIRLYPRNYLLHLELAQMYSDLGKKEEALAALAEVERMKRAALPGFKQMPLEKVFYFRGNLLFWYREPEAAIENLLLATAQAAALDPNTGVMAWMRLGQCYDMRGEREKAIAAYRQAMTYAPGSAAARESAGYARSPYRRK